MNPDLIDGIQEPRGMAARGAAGAPGGGNHPATGR